MQSVASLISSMSGYAPLTEDLYLFGFFWIGFLIIRSGVWFLCGCNRETSARSFRRSLSQLQEDFRLRRYEEVLDGWANLEEHNVEALCLVVSALTALGRSTDIGEFIVNAAKNLPHLRSSLQQVVAAVAAPADLRASSRLNVASAIRNIYDDAWRSLDEAALNELLLALAEINDERRVKGLLNDLEAMDTPASTELLGKLVQRFLAGNNLDGALEYLQQILGASSAADSVPHDLVAQVVKVSTEASLNEDEFDDDVSPKAWDALDALKGFQLTAEVATLFLDWSARQTPVDVPMASRIEHMLRQTGAVHASAYDALVRVHASSAGDEAKAIECFDELVRVADATDPSEASLVAMISSCVETRNSILAEHIFEWAEAHGRCTSSVLSVTLKVLATAEKAESVCAVYESIADRKDLVLDQAMSAQIARFASEIGRSDIADSLRSNSPKPSAQDSVSSMRMLGQEGKVDKVLEVLRDHQQSGDVDYQMYKCALDACLSCGDEAGAKTILKEMQDSGCVDVTSYNIMLKHRMSENATPLPSEKVLMDMQQRGLQPNTATYNILLSSALGSGDFDGAWRTIDLMDRSGQGVDFYTLTMLFRGYRHERRTMDAESLDRALGFVKTYDVKVDDILVTVALEACLVLRDIQRSKKALTTFHTSGWSVSKQTSMYTYGVLIKAYGQSQDLDEAWRLWSEVTVERNVEANEQLYGQMLDVLVSNGRLEDALTLFKDMKAIHKNSLNSQGFSVAYGMIIRGYAQRKNCGRALQCYEEMKGHGITVSLVVLNTLIDACSRVGDMDSASRVFQDMLESHGVPDLITYSTLIKGHCINNDMDQALKLFAQMQHKGIKPDAVVFNSLLDGCAKKQVPQLCEQLIADMEKAGVSPSNHSASILIKLYGRCQDMDAAFRVINDMPRKYGFRANNAVYTCLMSACITNGKLSQAMELRTRMLQEGIQPDEKTYSTLLRGALRASDPDQCRLLVDAALNQSASARHLLNEELVNSVLSLLHRRGCWEQHGRDLLARLRRGGVSVRCSPDGPQGASYRHEGSERQRDGYRNYGGSRDMGAYSEARPQQYWRGQTSRSYA